MKLDVERTLQCVENKDEAPSVVTEAAYQLSCFIDSNVKHMLTGLKSVSM